jgi:hypothetical protein
MARKSALEEHAPTLFALSRPPTFSSHPPSFSHPCPSLQPHPPVTPAYKARARARLLHAVSPAHLPPSPLTPGPHAFSMALSDTYTASPTSLNITITTLTTTTWWHHQHDDTDDMRLSPLPPPLPSPLCHHHHLHHSHNDDTSPSWWWCLTQRALSRPPTLATWHLSDAPLLQELMRLSSLSSSREQRRASEHVEYRRQRGT